MAEIEFPEKLQFLFDPSRYKVAYGGRGGGKSQGIARALLVLGTQKPLRILCARELMGSIADSVHKLLSDQIGTLDLAGFYKIEKQGITGMNGTEFLFTGLRNNVSSVRSTEGVDIAWIEEAANVSKLSWETLIPTIRKDGSELWISFNPELSTDETYRRFVLNPPANAIVRKINWNDNPWFPRVLLDEKLDLERRDPDAALTVWEGHPRAVLSGAIYTNELRAATAEGRITRVPFDPTVPIQTFWDLGFADATSIWFAQRVGMETRVVDFYSNTQQALTHYLKVLQNRDYLLGTCWLPHDARAKQLGTGKSVEELMRAAGRDVRIVPNLAVEDGINATRVLFSNFFFDEQRCADGLNSLRRYRYDIDQHSGQTSRKPLHDDASHAADALRYLAVALQDKPKKVRRSMSQQSPTTGSARWLGG